MTDTAPDVDKPQFILRQFMNVSYWSGKHATYQHLIRHNNGAAPKTDLINEMIKELNPADGELINIEIRLTGTKPRSSERIEFVSPHKYDWRPRHD